MSIDYNTAHVEPHRRFDYWKEVVCRHCIPAHSHPVEEITFDGQLQVRALGPVDLCTVGAPQHHWERTAKHVRSQPDDDLWLGLMESSSGFLEQNGRRAKLAPRDMVLYDADQTFTFEFGGAAAHLMRIPRGLLSRRLPGVENLTAMTLDSQKPGISPLREMMLQATTHPLVQEDPRIGQRFSETIVELLVLSLELQRAADTGSDRDLYARAMRHVRNHLDDSELSLDNLASALHVSPRTLIRAFARHQKTPMASIWQERLQASRTAIEQRRVRSVSQAALEFGFSDFSHFSHAFRKAFGVAPSALLYRD